MKTGLQTALFQSSVLRKMLCLMIWRSKHLNLMIKLTMTPYSPLKYRAQSTSTSWQVKISSFYSPVLQTSLDKTCLTESCLLNPNIRTARPYCSTFANGSHRHHMFLVSRNVHRKPSFLDWKRKEKTEETLSFSF